MHFFQFLFGLGTFLLSVRIQSTESAHIVLLQHIAGHSHIIASWNFAQALLAKGHNITYIAPVPPPFPTNNPSMTYIHPKRISDFMDDVINLDFDVNTRLEGLIKPMHQSFVELNTNGCEALLDSEEIQTWVNSTQTVDLIYVDNFAECGLGLAYKLQAKLAIFATLPMFPSFFETFAIPFESSSAPSLDSTAKTPISFIERVKLTLLPLVWQFGQIRSHATIESCIKEHLQLDYLPPMEQLIKNVSLILTNGHFLDKYRRSLPPFVVSVPGMHVRDTHDPLTKEIEEFINSTNAAGESQGFVYISLGTVAKAPKLPQSIREVIYNSIKAFPEIRFLWRWDGDFPTDIPNNLKLAKWFNQQDILYHPKIRGFVTQAGRPSSQEGVYHAVPMITFPILGDQDYNANALESLGVSINLEIVDVTQEQLTNALHTILHEFKFKERSLEVAKLYRDLPMKPIDTAIWWTEYILRHKDTSHLKPLAIDQTWYQRRLLDVWAFITIISVTAACLAFVVFITAIKFLIRILSLVIMTQNKPSKLKIQ